MWSQVGIGVGIVRLQEMTDVVYEQGKYLDNTFSIRKELFVAQYRLLCKDFKNANIRTSESTN